MKLKKAAVTTLTSLLTLAAPLSADTVQTVDGASLVGTITGIYDGTLTLETEYAGTLEVDMDKVAGFETDEPVFVKTEDGEVMSGPARSLPNGDVAIAGQSGTLAAKPEKISSSWREGEEDPEVVAREEAIESEMRNWSFEVGANISGKSGNTDKSNIGFTGEAKLSGPNDMLLFYGSYDYSEEDGQTTAEEIIGGVEFESFVSTHWGWYVREELEKDEFEGIEFRSTSGVGLSYRFIKRERMTLVGRSGISYLYEDFTPVETPPGSGIYVDPATEDSFGLDFGLRFYWQFAEWGELNTDLTYTPAFEDFGNYRATHESKVSIPLAFSDAWKLQLGLRNEYSSDVPPTKDELDTEYFLRLIMQFE